MEMYRLSSRAVIIKDQCILLNAFNGGAYYNFPGGGVEEGETLGETVVREVLEETGYRVEVEKMIFLYEYNGKMADHKYGPRNALSYFFVCHIDEDLPQGEISVVDQDPHNPENISTGYEWVDIMDIDKINLIPNIQDYLYAYLKGDVQIQFIEEGVSV